MNLESSLLLDTVCVDRYHKRPPEDAYRKFQAAQKLQLLFALHFYQATRSSGTPEQVTKALFWAKAYHLQDSEVLSDSWKYLGGDQLMETLGESDLYPYPIHTLINAHHSPESSLDLLKSIQIQGKDTRNWELVDFWEFLLEKMLAYIDTDIQPTKYIFFDTHRVSSQIRSLIAEPWRDGKIPEGADQLLTSAFGNYWQSYYGLHDNCFHRVYFIRASIPQEANSLVFQNFIAENVIPKIDGKNYMWTDSNPLVQWSCIWQGLLSQTKKTPLTTRNNLEKVGVSADLIDALLDGELIVENILQKQSAITVGLMNHYYCRSLVLKSDGGSWFSADPILIYQEERGQSTKTKASRGVPLHELFPIKNRFYLVSEDTDLSLDEETQQAYFPTVGKTVAQPWWTETEQPAYKAIDEILATSSSILTSQGNGLVMMNLSNTLDSTITQPVNLIKVFNMYPLSPIFPLISLYSGKGGQNSLKLYSPTVLMTQQPWDTVPVEKVLRWYQKEIAFSFWYDASQGNLQENRAVSLLVRLQAYPVGVETERAEILHLHNKVATIRIVSDQSVHTDIPLQDIIVEKNNLDTLQIGDTVKISRFDFCYGYLQISQTGEVKLYTQAYQGSSISRALEIATHRLQDFLRMIQSIGYLINSTQSRPISMPHRYVASPLTTICPVSWTTQYQFTLPFGAEIDTARFVKLISLYSTLARFVSPEYLPRSEVESLIDGEDWVRSTIQSVDYTTKKAVVSVSETERTVDLPEQLRFLEERKSGKLVQFIFSLSGETFALTDLMCMIGTAKQWNLTNEKIISLISTHYHFPRRDAEKNYQRLKTVSLPGNCCLISIYFTKNQQCKVTVDPSLTGSGAKQTGISIMFTQYLIQQYLDTLPELQVQDPTLQVIQETLSDPDLGNTLEELATPEVDKPDAESDSDYESQSDTGKNLLETALTDFQEQGKEEGVLSEDSDSEDDDEKWLQSEFQDSEEEGDTEDSDLDLSTAIGEDENETEGEATTQDTSGDTYEVGVSRITENISYSSREPDFPRWTDAKNPLLDRINEYLSEDTDAQEPGKSTGKKRRMKYSTECQGQNRQPMIITQTTKDFIDRNLPGSYGQLGEYRKDTKVLQNKICSGDKRLDPDNEQCIALKLKDEKNWVICPLLSCFYCWISIHPDQLQPNYGNVDPTLLIERGIQPKDSLSQLLQQYGMSRDNLALINDTSKTSIDQWFSQQTKILFTCNQFVPSDPQLKTPRWRICANCNLGIEEHNVYCPLCMRGLLVNPKTLRENWDRIKSTDTDWKIKKWDETGDIWHQKLTQKTYLKRQFLPKQIEFVKQRKKQREEWYWGSSIHKLKRSVTVREDKKGDMYIFPAFHNNFNPCCYQQKPSSKIKNVNAYYNFPSSKVSDTNYLLQESKPLTDQRMGYLPSSVAELFGSQIPGFVRVGVSRGPFDLFHAISYLDRETLSTDKILQWIYSVTTDEVLQSVSGGSLPVLFSDSDPRISPLQNYLEYTFSDQPKDESLYLGLFHNSKIAPLIPKYPNGVRIVFLSVEKDLEGKETVKIACGTGGKTIQAGEAVAFILKRSYRILGDQPSIEPLVFYYGENSSTKPVSVFQFQAGQSDLYRIHSDHRITLGEPLLKVMNQALLKCNLDHSRTSSVPGTGFTHSPTHTSFTALLQILRKQGIPLKAQKISREGRLVGILTGNNLYLPIYPRPPLLGYPHISSEEWQQLHKRSMVDVVKTLQALNREGGYQTTPRYICSVGKAAGFQGIVTEHGFYIPTSKTQDTLKTISDQTSIDFQVMDYPYEELNYLLDNKNSPQDLVTDYSLARKAIDAYKTIHSLADGYPQFKPIAYTSESDYHGLILNTGFIFPTRDITMEVAKKLNLPRVSLRNGTWTGDSISIPLVSLETLLNQSQALYSYSAGKLQSRIYRVYLDSVSKQITRVILECGYAIPIQPQPLVTQAGTSRSMKLSFKIPLIKLPKRSFQTSLRLYENQHMDSRVKGQIKKDLIDLQYKMLRTELAEYLFVHTELQKTLQKLREARSIPLGVRKAIVTIILGFVLNEIASFENTSTTDHKKSINVTCQGLSGSYCTQHSHCRWSSQQKLVQPNMFQYVLDNAINIVAKNGYLKELFQQEGIAYPEDQTLSENLTRLIQHKFPQADESQISTCSVIINDTGNPLLKKQFIDQLAEEIIRINTRSREILKKRIFAEEEDGLIFREGDEFLMLSPTLASLKNLLGERLSQNLLSSKIPFSLATDNSLETYQQLVPLETLKIPRQIDTAPVLESTSPSGVALKSTSLGEKQQLAIRFTTQKVRLSLIELENPQIQVLNRATQTDMLALLIARNNPVPLISDKPRKMTIRFIDSQ